MDDLISRQAAIERFDYIRPRDPMTSDYTHGIDVGIALCKVAIREQPPAQLGTNLAEVGTDCISRQAAIDLLKQMRKDGDMIPWEGKDVFARIRKLPSAQPDIIRCRNCKFASGDSRICMKFGHSPIGELDFCAWAERRTDE